MTSPNHPDWFLHDQNGRIIQAGPLQNYLMDQRRPELPAGLPGALRGPGQELRV